MMIYILANRAKFLFAIGALFISSSIFAQSNWSNAASLPSPRQEIYATMHDGLIYTAGGLTENASAVRDDFLVYDPQTDTWRTLANLPAPRHHVTLSAGDDEIFAIGGFSGAFPDWKPEASVYSYSTETSLWSVLPDLPVARGEHISAVVEGRIYVVGGRVGGTRGAAKFNEHRDTSQLDIYDPATRSWSRGADAPTARNSAASAVISGKIYVVGGRQYLNQPDGNTANVNVASLEVYDPETGLWTVKAPMPKASGAPAAATVDGKLYVFGGEQWVPTKKVFGDAWVYDPSTDVWSPIPSLNIPRHGLAAAATENNIYAIGGATETGAGDVVTVEMLSATP
ncbi:Kelch repeat-containing protein [Parasphingorhabdus cellanae]|uniref:Uncharacterized protein n=1 Tax=Parasphingorhabdus cellanae TaxID=2806553 RepID=A0ABX7T773_9SPHN|nr:kelch repeat-containing protein [Parasphingorhabdus cellanae]QTD57458.1 hypothetical protein J4G78_08010 [Parasphingorhabdus cellanae]